MAARQAVPRNPLRNFQFHVGILHVDPGAAVDTGQLEWVAGVHRVSGLAATVGVTETWSGGNNWHRYASPERVTWDPVTIEQGVALGFELEEWADEVRTFAATGVAGTTRVKRCVVIDMWDPFPVTPGADDQIGPARAQRFLLRNAWISRYQALPRLDALGSEVGLVSAEIVYEGWRRVTAPTDEILPANPSQPLLISVLPEPPTA